MKMKAQRLKAQLSKELIDQKHVSGIGVGENEHGQEIVVVNVESGKSHTVTIPQEYNSEMIEVRETGPFSAEIVKQKDPQQIDRKAKHRPVPGGVSAGHVNVTAGTTGYIVQDADGNTYPSSNNHVYANVNQGAEGEAIIQPGSADGGTIDDTSGSLAGYVPIENGATLDFAWINPSVEHTLELYGVGKPQGDPVEVSVGDVLIKSGRTTGVTEATVDQTSADVNVNYGDNTYTINDCIITGDMSEGGDSGSATLMKSSNRPAGVLFAGSSSATVHSKATNIKPETGLTIVTDGGSGGGGGGDTTPTASVSITLQKETPETGNINVTVTDQNGTVIEGATVTIEGPTTTTSTTDSTGLALFEGVEIADWTVSANKSGYTQSSVTVTSGDFN